MITKNFEDYPEHRLKFFSLLRAIGTHCFQALIQLSSQVSSSLFCFLVLRWIIDLKYVNFIFLCFFWLLDNLFQQLKLVIDSINWAFRHTERNIAETGLSLLLEILKNFQVGEYVPSSVVSSLMEANYLIWCHCRLQDSKINSTKPTFWQLSKRFLLSSQTRSTNLVSSFMFWCYSTCFVWCVYIHPLPCRLLFYTRSFHLIIKSLICRWTVSPSLFGMPPQYHINIQIMLCSLEITP